MSEVNREIKVLMLVTMKAEPNWRAVEFSDRIAGPALVEADGDPDYPKLCAWDPMSIFDDLALTLRDEFPAGKGNPYRVKSVKLAIAP